MTQRTDRVDELLRQEIGAIIAKEIDDPRVGFVTITNVETTSDLSHAQVWVSVIGSADERTETLRALGRAMPYIRRQLGARIRIRRIPELHLKADDTLERGTRVLRLLTELEAGADPDQLIEPLDALPTPVPRLPHEGDAPEPAPDRQVEPPGHQLRPARRRTNATNPARRATPRRRGNRT
jgi:ribosome-binding factor A